jgi:hypothetical protein
MADRDSSRRTRQSGRSGGNRPRTHPKRPQGRRPGPKSARVSAPPPRKSTKVLADLTNMRFHLEIAMAAAIVTSLALEKQNAEVDPDAALILRRCVADELSRQLDRLDHILANARMIPGDLAVPGGGS